MLKNKRQITEFGTPPLSVFCKQRSSKFWCKILSNINSFSCDTHWDHCDAISINCWEKNNISIMEHIGLTNIRLNFDRNFNYFTIYKIRLYDQLIQSWNMSINNWPKFASNCKFSKKNFLMKNIKILFQITNGVNYLLFLN